MNPQVRIGRARDEDHPAMARLLVASGFATHGLAETGRRWVVARLGEHVIGCGSMTLSGSNAVMDNVAVAASHRRRSIGSTLVGVLLDNAAESGATDAYVTTRDSGGFFRRMRWRTVSRMEAMERTGLKVQGELQAFAVTLDEPARASRSEHTQGAWLDGNLAR